MKFVVIALLAIVALAYGKVYTEEEFMNELKAANVTAKDAAVFTCIADYVSGLDTEALVVGPSSGDFGVFQISSAYWCSPPGKACGLECESLLDDDIQNDIECALKIKKIHGFWAWQAYQFCK